MVLHRAGRQALLPWVVLGPLCVGAGAAIGIWWKTAPEAVVTPGFAPLVEAAKVSVVGVRTIHQADSRVRVEGSTELSAVATEGVSRGTGFLLHADGLVVTAHHLVARPSRIVVEIPGHGPREAELIGEDPVTDIAALRIIDPPDDLVPLRLGRSEDVRQGDWVVTIGNPLRLRQTVSAGVVGFVGRHIRLDAEGDEGGITNEHLQFGSPAYPGSSGSPVFATSGEVVGMTTRSVVDGEGYTFAVTSRVIRKVLDAMERDQGRVRRAQFGAGVDLTSGGPRRGEHPEAEGVAVELTRVARGRAAHRAGLREGDIVVDLEGRPIESLEAFYDALTWAEPGSAVHLRVARGETPPKVYQVELDELGKPPANPAR